MVFREAAVGDETYIKAYLSTVTKHSLHAQDHLKEITEAAKLLV